MRQFILIMVAGAVTENLLFARAFGVDRIIDRSRSYKKILSFGLMYCFTVCLGSVFAWEVRSWFETIWWWNDVRGLMVLLCIIVSYFILLCIVGFDRVKSTDSAPVVVAFNGASFGAVFLSIANYQKLLEILTYCLGCSVGITVAMMLVHSGRERLEVSRIHKSFAGIPITMIYIGILGLAVYGLMGHRLPT